MVRAQFAKLGAARTHAEPARFLRRTPACERRYMDAPTLARRVTRPTGFDFTRTSGLTAARRPLSLKYLGRGPTLPTLSRAPCELATVAILTCRRSNSLSQPFFMVAFARPH
jgi:hypothetical protein